MPGILENYFRRLRDINSSGAGVPETSYYGAFETLFNEIAKPLKPRVRAIMQLGGRICDIYFNATGNFHNVPTNVWKFVTGGYQVTKKWLSYREQSLLGRSLTPVEAREARIASILLLQPSLDDNYQVCQAEAYSWPPNSTSKEIS